MAYDYKREYPELYRPSASPAFIEVPEVRFIAVRGSGDPNAPESGYGAAVGALYAVAYAIKMSRRGDRQMPGYFDFVVPPLEGFWRQPGRERVDLTHKEGFQWTACLRLPDFVGPDDLAWAVAEATRRRGRDLPAIGMLTLREGLCAQLMHTGPYDAEPASIARLEAFIGDNGCAVDLTDAREHHEIYLSDPRRTQPDRLKTVIRLPVRRMQS